MNGTGPKLTMSEVRVLNAIRGSLGMDIATIRALTGLDTLLITTSVEFLRGKGYIRKNTLGYVYIENEKRTRCLKRSSVIL